METAEDNLQDASHTSLLQNAESARHKIISKHSSLGLEQSNTNSKGNLLIEEEKRSSRLNQQ